MRHLATIVFLVLLFIVVGMALVTFQDNRTAQSSTRTETHVVGAESPQPEYCLRDTITGQSGEVVISEQEGGKYDYQIIATTHGIEVWVPCN